MNILYIFFFACSTLLISFLPEDQTLPGSLLRLVVWRTHKTLPYALVPEADFSPFPLKTLSLHRQAVLALPIPPSPPPTTIWDGGGCPSAVSRATRPAFPFAFGRRGRETDGERKQEADGIKEGRK
jgi:hypothetical protein